MKRRLLIAPAVLAVAMPQFGCTIPFFSGPILDFLGPTSAVAVAEPDAVVNSGQAVTLDGSASFLSLGSGSTRSAQTAGFTFAWTVAATPAAAVPPTLTNANSSQVTFTGTTPGSYTVQLMVSDGVFAGTTSVRIEVL